MFMLQSKIIKWVNSEVEKKLDEQSFFSLPLRMRIGIFLLMGSFIIGYGYPIVSIIISGIKHQLSAGLIDGSLVYLISWIVGAIGLSLAGKDCIKYPIYFFAKLLKTLFPRYFTDEINRQRNKKRRRITKFHIVTFSSLIGIIIVIILSFLFSSIPFLLYGTIIIVCIHQAIYIYGMFSAGSNLFFNTVKGKEYFNNQNGILLRFDDGPHPVYTPQILDILRTERIQALFALTGANAEKCPELVERIYREGHIIANHTYSHPFNILFLGYNRVRNEISRTSTIIQEITGAKPKYFCPPIGFKNQVIGKVTEDLGLIPVMWDIRTLDTKAPLEKIMSRIRRKFKSPAIIMFHDAIMPWSKEDRESTILALKETIKFLKKENVSENK